MICTILTLLTVIDQSCIRPDLLSQHKFVRIASDPKIRFAARRSTDGSELRWKFRSVSNERIAQEIAPTRQSAIDTSRFNYSSSGLPLGSRCTWTGALASGVVTVIAGGFYEIANLQMLGAVQQSGRSKWFAQLAPNMTEPVLEILCREVLSNYAAQRMSADGNVSVSGRSYPAMKASGTNARFIDLSSWASANSLTVSTGQDGTVKSFTKGGTLWIVPLASNKIKKGSVWQTLPDIVMQKDGKFMIPISALSN